MIKRIPSGLKIFNWKNKRYVYLPIPQLSLSKGHPTLTIRNHQCYCFMASVNVFVIL